jgi:molybdate/tungstate transport system substrate-binding protein
MRRILFFAVLLLLIVACMSEQGKSGKEVIIFHAGSLTVPLNEIARSFEKENPGVKILTEAAGSLVCARKVTELKKPCDIVASADYFVIDKMLIPGYASWGIRFATNEIVIAYSEKSKYSGEIDSTNWFEILQRPDVIYSRSDPDSDPCGYRSVLTFMLSEKYYNKPGLTEKFLIKDKAFIRPKEVDLVALLDAGATDYMFQYKSVAIQHGMKFLELPDQVNLSDPEHNYFYKTASVDVVGSSPGSTMRITGEYINYSLTVINQAPNRELAERFVEYVISPAGMEIFRKNGQDPIIPFSTDQKEKLPQRLLKHLKNNPAEK